MLEYYASAYIESDETLANITKLGQQIFSLFL